MSFQTAHELHCSKSQRERPGWHVALHKHRILLRHRAGSVLLVRPRVEADHRQRAPRGNIPAVEQQEHALVTVRVQEHAQGPKRVQLKERSMAALQHVVAEARDSVGAAVEWAGVGRVPAGLFLVCPDLGEAEDVLAAMFLELAGPGHAGQDLLHGAAPDVARGLVAAGALALQPDTAVAARRMSVLALKSK